MRRLENLTMIECVDLFIASFFLYLWRGPYNHLSNNAAHVKSVYKWEQQMDEAGCGESLAPLLPRFVDVSAFASITVAGMWKEFLTTRVTLATSATNVMKSSYIQFCDISGVQE